MQFKHVIGQTQPARLGRMEIAETSTHRSPLKIFGVSPTDRVGVVGSGGLGHLALTFALVARLPLSTSGKANEVHAFGAHHVVNSRDDAELRSIAKSLDLLLVTVNVPLNWSAMISTLRPIGRLHFVGAVLE